MDIESGAVVNAQTGLNLGRGRWKSIVGGGRRQHDQVDIAGRHSSAVERPTRRRQSQIGGHLAFRRDMSLADTGAFENPFIGGVDAGRELGVGDHPRRQISSLPHQ